jgi:H+-translocating NAD(P) transhydrogenase subunit beta
MDYLQHFIPFGYIIASILFIFGLKMLSKPSTARQGNFVSAVGMFVAIISVLLNQGLDFSWIIVGIIIGSVVGAVAARKVKMTAMPEMVALFNGFGGIASLLVGWAEYHKAQMVMAPYTNTSMIAIYLAILIGGVTFAGSLIAYLRLSETIDGKPTIFKFQHLLNLSLLIAVFAGCAFFVGDPYNTYSVLLIAIALSLVLGVLVVIPIGGADMPVVISLLNSYSGLAACAAGFIINNEVLIVAGALVGASGIILTNIMCKAMNRSITNVLFGGFGAKVTSKGGGKAAQGEVRPITPADAFFILEAADTVSFVPGYGMAVAQAQHVVHELGQLLEKNGTEVTYAVHPVAGRMPGHMNVLLAEADVPYDQLVEMDDINPIMETIDVCVVIGANDVVNPAARTDESSPIYGMPIINVVHAKTVFVLKRSMNPGFAGIDNPLFYGENTRMLFGDAKNSIQALVGQFKDL